MAAGLLPGVEFGDRDRGLAAVALLTDVSAEGWANDDATEVDLPVFPELSAGEVVEVSDYFSSLLLEFENTISLCLK